MRTDGKPAVSVEFVDECVDRGPRLRVIPWEDGVILPVCIRYPKEARGIGERINISGEELILGAKQGKYSQDAVDEIVSRPSDELPKDRAERMDQQGINSDGSTAP